MGFFNRVFSFLGFEGESSHKPKQERKAKTNRVKSSFELNPKNRRKSTQVQTKKIATEQEIVEVIDLLKAQGALIVDLSGFDKTKKTRAFDFISGAVFALEGQVEKLKPNIYICSLDELDYFLGEGE